MQTQEQRVMGKQSQREPPNLGLEGLWEPQGKTTDLMLLLYNLHCLTLSPGGLIHLQNIEHFFLLFPLQPLEKSLA